MSKYPFTFENDFYISNNIAKNVIPTSHNIT